MEQMLMDIITALSSDPTPEEIAKVVEALKALQAEVATIETAKGYAPTDTTPKDAVKKCEALLVNKIGNDLKVEDRTKLAGAFKVIKSVLEVSNCQSFEDTLSETDKKETVKKGDTEEVDIEKAAEELGNSIASTIQKAMTGEAK